ncbi:hypothetical protein [Crocosphaera sp.]|uniref:hypothetical protein n=1 Tax=Crocosphaera sp. TaxID=2729996 RepID=UPI0026356D63|nr:hypothetical protein [Crocosphaera sp.]MDJ0579116.1 hypothetical protein [Crocosphaera sp.]
MKNKVIKHTIVDGTGLFCIYARISIFITSLFFCLTWISSRAGNIASNIVIILLCLGLNKIVVSLGSSLFKKADAKRKIAYGYRRSIKETQQTEYPEGIVYILKNVLQELDRLGIDFPPSKKSVNMGKLESRATDSTIVGFPNRTNLKEAINMAQDLSQEWSNLNHTEKSRSMGEIRAKIESEDMWLAWYQINLPKGEVEAYWFSYTEEDHRNNKSFSSATPQTPTPKPQPPSNPSQILNYEEFINQNSIFQDFSEQEKLETYQKYLKSKGVNILSFDEWLSQNSEYQFFPQEQQQQAYLKYLKSLGDNSH